MSDKPVKSAATDLFGVHVARSVTQARLGIGRAGGSLTTRELLDFDLAHARARDAVQLPWDAARFEADLKARGRGRLRDVPVLHLKSAAADRATYLKRPDYGRRLAGESARTLETVARNLDIALIVSDGLSAQAATVQAAIVLESLVPAIFEFGWTMSPILAVPFARVGISDHVGSIIKCRVSVILLGERPGLATPESLGAYLTFEPGEGRSDANRNCISNIHGDGIRPAAAADAIVKLIQATFRHRVSGVSLSMHIAGTVEAFEQSRIGGFGQPGGELAQDSVEPIGTSAIPVVPGGEQDAPERHPPDQVVGQQDRSEREWQRTFDQGLKETDRSEDLAQKADEDDRPVAKRVKGGDTVAQAVNADDHADALPEFRIVGSAHAHDVECRVGQKNRPKAENDVVSGGHDEAPLHPQRTAGGRRLPESGEH